MSGTIWVDDITLVPAVGDPAMRGRSPGRCTVKSNGHKIRKSPLMLIACVVLKCRTHTEIRRAPCTLVWNGGFCGGEASCAFGDRLG